MQYSEKRKMRKEKLGNPAFPSLRGVSQLADDEAIQYYDNAITLDCRVIPLTGFLAMTEDGLHA